MKNFKGFLFDMDGVLVDNHQYHYRAWEIFCQKHDLILTPELYRDRFNGKKSSDLFKMLFGDISVFQIEEYTQEKEKYYQDIYKEHMAPVKGLIDFLDFLSSRRYKLALGTSAPTFNVDFILDQLFIRKYFDVIVDGTQVERGKPDPQVYQLCAYKLGLDPKECVVFEDALAGLESGKRAGSTIVGVATSHEAHELRPLTELIIHDFIEARKVLRLH